ncbi:MAG: Fe-S cluster assembly sulfur transfer protein SufU [Acidimicrobiales bacterium]
MPGLEDLYREIILDHYRSPRNRGELPAPPATRVEGFNPLCGDEVVVYLRMEGSQVADIAISGQGCSISQSSASMMTQAVKGRELEEARRVIRTFKGMMSIHESHLDEGDGAGGAAGGGTGTRAGNGAADPDASEPPVRLGDLEALRGVVKFPVRIKCATLPWNALAQALDEAGAATASSDRQ